MIFNLFLEVIAHFQIFKPIYKANIYIPTLIQNIYI